MRKKARPSYGQDHQVVSSTHQIMQKIGQKYRLLSKTQKST
jgi:hypothetical protein